MNCCNFWWLKFTQIKHSKPVKFQKWQFLYFYIFWNWFHVKSQWQKNHTTHTAYWNHGNLLSLIFEKKFVKVTFSQNNWFDEIFFSGSIFFFHTLWIMNPKVWFFVLSFQVILHRQRTWIWFWPKLTTLKFCQWLQKVWGQSNNLPSMAVWKSWNFFDLR